MYHVSSFLIRFPTNERLGSYEYINHHISCHRPSPGQSCPHKTAATPFLSPPTMVVSRHTSTTPSGWVSAGTDGRDLLGDERARKHF